MYKAIGTKHFKECPVCDKEHDVEIRQQMTEVHKNGITFRYPETYYYCHNASPAYCEFEDGKLMDENIAFVRKELKNHATR